VSIGDQVEEAELSPDVRTLTVLIKALGTAGRVDEAEEVFGAMRQKANHFADATPPNEVGGPPSGLLRAIQSPVA
jgi:pentatricopeptide repeat protein